MQSKRGIPCLLCFPCMMMKSCSSRLFFLLCFPFREFPLSFFALKEFHNGRIDAPRNGFKLMLGYVALLAQCPALLSVESITFNGALVN